MGAAAPIEEEASDFASSTGFLPSRRRASAKFPQAFFGY